MLTDEKVESYEKTGMIVAAVVVLICTAGAPRSDTGPTREQLARAYVRGGHRIVQLQSSLRTAESQIKAQKVEMAGVSTSVAKLQEQMLSVQKERDEFKGRTTDATAKIKELENQLSAARAETANARAEITKLNDKMAKDDTPKQRDEAIARANKAEDRIRELTLQLHNAGIWP
jgi:chromosome segregation ATPase